MSLWEQALVGVMLTATAASARADGRIGADVEAGAGYGDNLNLAPRAGEKAGSEFLFASAVVDLGAHSSEETDVFAEAAAAVNDYQEYSDLSSAQASLRLGLIRSVGARQVMSLSAMAGGQGYGDSGRDAVNLGGSVALGQRLTRIFSWRIGYQFLDHNAEVETFDYQRHRAIALVALGPPELELDVAYRFDRADTTLYMTQEEARTPEGSGRRGQTDITTFNDTTVAYLDDTHTHSGLAALSYRPAEWLRVRVSYELATIRTSDASVRAQEIAVSIRFTARQD